VPSRRRAQPDACRRPLHISGRRVDIGRLPKITAGPRPQSVRAPETSTRSPDIEPEKSTEEVEFEAFDPSDRHTDVSGERDVDTRAGRGDPDPPAIVGKVLADRRRQQPGREFWSGVERCLHERVRVGPWPSAVIPVGSKFVVFDDVTDLRNERVGTLAAVHGDDRFRQGSELSAVGSEAITSGRCSPRRVVLPAIAARTFFLHEDPGVDRNEAAPSHRACREDPDQGIGMLGRWW
jgi:hypothetical protein